MLFMLLSLTNCYVTDFPCGSKLVKDIEIRCHNGNITDSAYFTLWENDTGSNDDDMGSMKIIKNQDDGSFRGTFISTIVRDSLGDKKCELYFVFYDVCKVGTSYVKSIHEESYVF